MGKFVIKDVDRTRQYTVFSKKGYKNILALENVFPQYTFSFEEKDVVKDTYYDSKSNDLISAGIILDKVVENKSKSYIRIEREFLLQDQVGEKNKEEKVYIHQTMPKDTIVDHMFYIVDGIENLFSTTFHIDLQHVIKISVPKILIENKIKRYKVYGGTGFKAEMLFEEVSFKNFETKRKASTLMLTLNLLSPDKFIPHFNEFIKQLEKHEKELILSPESKYAIARKMTRPITQADIEREKLRKDKKKKENKD